MSCHWLTIDEAANFVSVHYTTLLRWIKAGKVAVSRPGPPGSRVTRICVADLNKYMEECRDESTGKQADDTHH